MNILIHHTKLSKYYDCRPQFAERVGSFVPLSSHDIGCFQTNLQIFKWVLSSERWTILALCVIIKPVLLLIALYYFSSLMFLCNELLRCFNNHTKSPPERKPGLMGTAFIWWLHATVFFIHLVFALCDSLLAECELHVHN